jgi:hypothetical protein
LSNLSPEQAADLESLALSLEAEVALATTRAAHIRASYNASSFRRIVSSLQQAESRADTAVS